MHGDTTRPQLPLEAFEQQHNLFDYKVDGWSAWRVMRNPIHRLAESLPLAQPTRSTFRRVTHALWHTLKVLNLMSRNDRRDLVVKTCRSGLRMSIGDRFRDVYFDGLLAHGYTFVKLEEVNSDDFEQQAAAACYPAELDPIVFTFWGLLLSWLFPVRSSRRFCADLAGSLKQDLGISLPAAWLNRRISTAYWQSRLYELLLRRMRPVAVLVADTGEYALCIACKRLGVKFIELQHGVFDAAHPDAVPARVAGSAAELLLPDVLACRGEFWIEQLAATRQGKERAVAVGNELIDLARARRQTFVAGERKMLVVSSQGLDSPRLARWLQDMVCLAPPERDWELSIKLHPIYDNATRDFDCLPLNGRIRLIRGAEQPNIFDLLAGADCHLSIASACHYDAAALGVPTVVVPLAGHEAMLSAIDGVHIHLARSPGEVWRVLDLPACVDGSCRYSAPGFIDNLRRLIARPRSIDS